VLFSNAPNIGKKRTLFSFKRSKYFLFYRDKFYDEVVGALENGTLQPIYKKYYNLTSFWFVLFFFVKIENGTI